MGPDRVKQVLEGVNGGNQNFNLLLRWGAKASFTELTGLPDDGDAAAVEIVLRRVNEKCGTTIKRLDLEANGEGYWRSGPGRRYLPAVNLVAGYLKEQIRQRTGFVEVK